jgi:hypothetical protein
MAKLSEVKAALSDVEEKTSAREEKEQKYKADQEAEATAIAAVATSREEWLAALKAEHESEDAFEALVIAYEPPAIP